MIRLAFAAALSVAALAASPVLAADGAQLFAMQCKMCHATAGSPMAPSLAGVAGSKIASKGFAYSPALKAKGGVWTDANLDAFLKMPSAFAPGTKMMISVPSDPNRAALVGYLKTLK